MNDDRWTNTRDGDTRYSLAGRREIEVLKGYKERKESGMGSCFGVT